jgi:hypothetical protein
MSARLASLALLAFAAIFSYIAFWMGYLLRPLYAKLLGIKSWGDLEILMPAISRAAADHKWIFVVLIVLACVATIFLFRRLPARIPQLMVAGLCVQALVLWLAMFCYFYDGFLGTVSMHHNQVFDIEAFISFAYGAFPITLVAILFPLVIALRSLSRKTS